jgi:hypothetical protein
VDCAGSTNVKVITEAAMPALGQWGAQ